MNIKIAIKEFLWMIIGAGLFLLVMILVMHFQGNQSPSAQLVLKARRLDLLDQIRLTLTSGSEAEKNSMLAAADKDSKIFADQARTATSEVRQESKELAELLHSYGTRSEMDLFTQFSMAFTNLQRIDSDLLALAVRNTNIKAFNLAFGPATDDIKEMCSALNSLVEQKTSSKNAGNIIMLDYEAQIAALHIQTLLAPHIYEESDKKMDDLEALMTMEDQNVQKHLNGLAMLPDLQNDPYLEKAISNYNLFTKTRKQILLLSRENTNIRSMEISLGQKRKMLVLCQDFLSALHQAIMDEKVAGVNYGTESNPRSLQIKK